ncbi:MAG: 2'-5' RNA ligase family protein [Sphingomonadaceae bacterium]
MTAEMPPDIFSWADALRRAHFPPERNRLKAHVTLFHALPPSVEDELIDLLIELAKAPPPEARISGLMKLGKGTALDVESPGVVELHGVIQDRMDGLMTKQDEQKLRLHITIQNKVSPEEAKALQAALEPTLEHKQFRFYGFGLYYYVDGLWDHRKTFPFRG